MTAIVIAALGLGACGEEEDELATVNDAVETSVCEAVADPSGRGEVLVRGRAFLPSARGFVLRAEGCSIFVAAPTKESTDAREGKPIQVGGLVERMRGDEVEVIARVIRERIDPADPPPRIPREVQIGPGEAYIDAFSVRGEDIVAG